MPTPLVITHGSLVAGLLNDAPPMPLGRGSPSEHLRAKLEALTPESIFAHTGKPVRDQNMAACCLSGLWLRHNYFDESHALSQEIKTPTGGFWHAILHRREPDYGNARYWFRRVGQHPIFSDLNDSAAAAGWPAGPRWDAFHFVDRVEQASRLPAEHATVQLCQKIQQCEWELLFDYCWQQALS